MELFKQDSNIDFMGLRRWTAMISVFLFLVSIGALLTNGLQWGLDFTGGTQIEAHYEKSVDLSQIRTTLAKNGYSDAVVQSYGNSTDILINVAPREHMQQTELVKSIMTILPGATKMRDEFVGPQVGKELAAKGSLAILVALLATMIYIALRFEARLAISAAVALIHDPMLILGIFALMHIDFDLKSLAALLAVIGYSLNDTIVVFDRVRENFRKLRKNSAIEIMNISINQTLSRTIMTSALTLIVVIALFLYGGETIHGFALAFLIGIVIGTYSSIYIAGALAISLGLDRKDLLPSGKKKIDELP